MAEFCNILNEVIWPTNKKPIDYSVLVFSIKITKNCCDGRKAHQYYLFEIHNLFTELLLISGLEVSVVASRHDLLPSPPPTAAAAAAPSSIFSG